MIEKISAPLIPTPPYVLAIGNSIGGNTSGGILFGNSANNLAQDSTNLFWDAVNSRLGIGQNVPTARLHVKGSGATSATKSLVVTDSNGNSMIEVSDSTSTGIYLRSINTSGIGNDVSGNLVLRSYNSSIEITNSNPQNSASCVVTTGTYTRTDSSIKSVISVQNAINASAASFNQLNGFSFDSTITQSVGKIVAFRVAPNIISATDFTAIEVVTGKSIFGGVVRLKGYTVATLPAGTVGDTAYVTDALLPAFLVAIAGGGAVTTKVFYNGANWVAG